MDVEHELALDLERGLERERVERRGHAALDRVLDRHDAARPPGRARRPRTPRRSTTHGKGSRSWIPSESSASSQKVPAGPRNAYRAIYSSVPATAAAADCEPCASGARTRSRPSCLARYSASSASRSSSSIGGVLRVGREADAHGEPAFGDVLPLQKRCSRPRRGASRRRRSAARVGLGQHDRELLAAVAAHHVDLADGAAQHRAELGERDVAGGVAVRVVELP